MDGKCYRIPRLFPFALEIMKEIVYRASIGMDRRAIFPCDIMTTLQEKISPRCDGCEMPNR
jgi:hypothetical protein